MTDPRKPVFDAVRAISRPGLFNDPSNVLALDNMLDAFDAPREQAFDRQTFLARYVNTDAPAVSGEDIDDAAARLNVPLGHIRALMEVESKKRSFDDKGRPIILFEPHVFWRRTSGKYGDTAYSYQKWGKRPYPASFDGRWTQMADAAAKDEAAALESASWGLFQIMGFHWRVLGYPSVQDFAARIAASEQEHLEALVRFIEANGLAPALRRCKAGDPDSCRDFARGYNGESYAAHGYHAKLAAAL